MTEINQKIIDAVIRKAEKICPDSLALIGVYGSVATGEAYEKSDLDLLILIENEAGWQLATGFLLDDSRVGYDIYCTNWDSLRYDAQCHHAQLSKLLDAKIVYIKNQAAYEELCRLRQETKTRLASEERFQSVQDLVGKAKTSFANAYLHDALGQVRLDAFAVMYYLTDALMLHHGQYFHRGTKHMLTELATLPIDRSFLDHIRAISECREVSELRAYAKALVLYAEAHCASETEKAKPSQNLAGTYEEIWSNWRNKVEEAAARSDSFAIFVNLCNLQYMFDGIAAETDIGTYDILGAYDSDNLDNNVRLFDACLRRYEEVYHTAGLRVRRYANVDEFVAEYLKI